MSTKKITRPSSHKIKTKKNEEKTIPNKKNTFFDQLSNAKLFTETQDPDYKKYGESKAFKKLVLNNPTLLILNEIYYTQFKKSLISQLLHTNNNELSNTLQYCFKLETLIQSKTDEKKNPVILGLVTKGFNTIFDIILENTDSFFFIGFLSHLVSEKIIVNPNQFIINIEKNKLYQELRTKKIIENMQLNDLFTRVKRYQF